MSILLDPVATLITLAIMAIVLVWIAFLASFFLCDFVRHLGDIASSIGDIIRL